MTRFVIEAPVAVKWFVPEAHSSPAARLLDGGNELYAPDTLFTDTGRILTAKIGLGELSPDEAAQVMEAVGTVPLRLLPTRTLLEPALRISAAFDLDFGHCVGLAVSIQCDCRLVTARRAFYDKLQGTPFAMHVKWVGDLR